VLLGVLAGAGGGFLGDIFGAIFSTGGTVGPRRAATGLVVPGSGYGDRVPALLTPGEVVLTRDDAKAYREGNTGKAVNLSVSFGSMFQSGSKYEMVRAGRMLRRIMRDEGLA